MKYTLKIISLFLAAVLVLSLVGCSSGSDSIIYFGLTDAQKAKNLDPQTASGDSELLIVRNIFEGLMRKNADGEIVCGACSDYQKSGTKYTFNLRKNIKWSDGTALCADDFVFGIRRAVENQTGCPFASRFFAIKNAREVNCGTKSGTELGVYARGDSVVIELNGDTPDFLETLTLSAAMPCNEDFFYKSEGKYGQSSDDIICNGSYKLTKWNREQFGIRLYKNDRYKGDFPAKNGGVFFSVPAEDEKVSQYDRLKKGTCDLAFLPPDQLKKAKRADIKVSSVENICWVLTLGKEYPLEVRSALLSAMSPSVYEDSLPDGFRAAYSIYPEILGEQGADGVGLSAFDVEGARQRFSAAVAKMPDKQFPAPTLTYFDDGGIKQIVTAAVAHWQQNLSAFINIEASDSLQTFSGEIGDRNLQMAVFPITANCTFVGAYMEKFGLSGDPVSAQQTLLSSCSVIPFAFEKTNIAYRSQISGVKCDGGNGYIDFSLLKKAD